MLYQLSYPREAFILAKSEVPPKSPHLTKLAEENAREFQETHDESGHPLTTRNGQGRESEGRR